jgi:hypothetical protein
MCNGVLDKLTEVKHLGRSYEPFASLFSQSLGEKEIAAENLVLPEFAGKSKKYYFKNQNLPPSRLTG